MSDQPTDPHDEVTRVSRASPPDLGAGPPRDGGRGWMLATVTIVALLLGVGAGVLINDGGDGETKTVRTGVRTVVSSTPAQTVTDTTVTREVRTVERTVTVTVPAETVDTQTTTTDGGG